MKFTTIYYNRLCSSFGVHRSINRWIDGSTTGKEVGGARLPLGQWLRGLSLAWFRGLGRVDDLLEGLPLVGLVEPGLNVLRDPPGQRGHRALKPPGQKDCRQTTDGDEGLGDPVQVHPRGEVKEEAYDDRARDGVPEGLRSEGHGETEHGAGHEDSEGLDAERDGLQNAAREGDDSRGVQGQPQRYGSLRPRPPFPGLARRRRGRDEARRPKTTPCRRVWRSSPRGRQGLWTQSDDTRRPAARPSQSRRSRRRSRRGAAGAPRHRRRHRRPRRGVAIFFGLAEKWAADLESRV